MALTLGINGFGRIGRLVLRSILERESNGEDFGIDVVGVNDLTDAETLAHLFQYDTAQGTYDGDVSYSGEDTITIDGEDFRVFSEKDPANLPWGDLGADVVVESTGLFRTREKASAHLDAGADKVIISAPAKSDDVPTFVLGVNDDDLSGDEDIVSNASCTTNSLAPLVKTLNDAFGIESGVMTTVHAYTASQNILDGPGTKDLRRARAAAESIIPTSTGAAQAIGLVVPELDGKLDGMAMRVPIPAGSITDLVVDLGTEASADEVNAAFRENADGPMSGVLEYNETPIVSTDVVHNPHSCIFDAPSTMTQGRQVKVLGWYDNEWGFANRMVDLARKLAS
ncbi:MAG: type I glyceraldehyde-3-phosphate dehydrogenase [Bacteroidetes bacterium QH_2_67_10]|jgi:glyceraldehyde 3-phosphate dehydrogenase|nr:MAG: type I glyceraldehyde-3-phosphate dehydrogenase [Bacteroidetes bacterium QH_2_67_10]PSQ78145.1 MAG: type I glyceraldehyde-3-phosphate dehydrogenase [Bacteroidetes bacterium QH_8_67_23]